MKGEKVVCDVCGSRVPKGEVVKRFGQTICTKYCKQE